MAVVGEAELQIRPDTKGFTSEAERGINAGFGQIAKSAALVFGSAFVAAGGFNFFKGAFSEAAEATKVAAQTEAVIKSTGAAAGVTAKQVDELASAISRKAGIDDEAIAKGENLLLTFTNVRNEAGRNNDIFNQATKIMVDMGVAMGGDASSSAIQLGKALNDPVAGITALTRVGVTFSDQQKEQIKTLVESGRTLDAQKIILAELNKEFGGSAEAQATAADKAKVAWGNFQETVGLALMPLLDDLLVALTGVVNFLGDNVGPAVSAVGDGFGRIVDIGRAVVDAFNSVSDGANGLDIFLGRVQNALVVLAQQLGFSEAQVDKLRAVLTEISIFIQGTLAPALENIAEVVGPALNEILGFIVDHWQLFAIGVAALVAPLATLTAGIIYAYAHFETFRDVVNAVAAAVAQFVTQVIDVMTTLVDGVRTRWEDIRAAIENVLTAIRIALIVFFAPVILAWKVFHDEIVAVLQLAWDNVRAIVEIALDYIKATIQAALDILIGIIDIFLGLLSGDWGRAWDGVKEVVGGAWEYIKAVIQAALAVITLALSDAWALISIGVQAAWDGIRAFFEAWWAVLQTVFSVPIAAIEAMLSAAWAVIDAAVHLAWDAIKAFFDAWWGALNSAVGTAVAVLQNTLALAWEAISFLIHALWDGIRAYFDLWWSGLQALFTLATDTIAFVLSNAWEGMRVVAEAVWTGIYTTINFIVTLLGILFDALRNDVRLVAAIFEMARDVMVGAWNYLYDKVSHAISSLIAWIERIPGAIDRALGPLDELIGKIGSLFGGPSIDDLRTAHPELFKAAGGPVAAGTSYIVGEVGPEVFVPSSAGTIISNAQIVAALGQTRAAGGSPSVTVQVNGNVYGVEDLHGVVWDALDEWAHQQQQAALAGSRG